MLSEIIYLLVACIIFGVLLICERSRRIWKRRASGYKTALDVRAKKYGGDVAEMSCKLNESKGREKSWREATARAEAEINSLRDELVAERNKFEVLRRQTGFGIDDRGRVEWVGSVSDESGVVMAADACVGDYVCEGVDDCA